MRSCVVRYHGEETESRRCQVAQLLLNAGALIDFRNKVSNSIFSVVLCPKVPLLILSHRSSGRSDCERVVCQTQPAQSYPVSPRSLNCLSRVIFISGSNDRGGGEFRVSMHDFQNTRTILPSLGRTPSQLCITQ